MRVHVNVLSSVGFAVKLEALKRYQSPVLEAMWGCPSMLGDQRVQIIPPCPLASGARHGQHRGVLGSLAQGDRPL